MNNCFSRACPRVLLLFLCALALSLLSCAGTGAPSGSLAHSPVQSPDISITDIRIMQAGLINTNFRVTIRIDNPNSRALTLSAFSYRLYSLNALWAQGTSTQIWTVAALESVEKELFFTMNFTGMPRGLLDKVIAHEKVPYRFLGTVQISAHPIPPFAAAFNLEGKSEVSS